LFSRFSRRASRSPPESLSTTLDKIASDEPSIKSITSENGLSRIAFRFESGNFKSIPITLPSVETVGFLPSVSVSIDAKYFPDGSKLTVTVLIVPSIFTSFFYILFAFFSKKDD
jgi:hypothetical protein